MAFKFELDETSRKKLVLCRIIEEAIVARKDRLNLVPFTFHTCLLEHKLVLSGDPHGQYSYVCDLNEAVPIR